MSTRSCPQGRAPVRAAPLPLYDQAVRETAAPLPLRPTVAAELPMCRHTHSIPGPSSPALGEVLCALRRQEELLRELLCAVNSLTAATLATRQQA